MTRTHLATAALFLLLSLPAAAAEPARRFQVPKGFVVEKVAGPPLVRYPLFACFDDRGRLFVAEGTGTNLPGEELVKKKLGRIVLLEDKDGDGTFDTSKVFADGLVFPQGVLWHDGAVYTASHPSIWKLEDPEGKGVATRRTELVKGFNFNGNGCDIHGPFLGPDGLLYWTDGRHGYKVRTREGQTLEGLAARVWRCRLDGSDIERLCGGGFDNPVELAWTADGEMVGTMDQGPGDCLLHYVEGGVYPMEHPCLQEFPLTGPLLGSMRTYSVALPAALCGTMRYRSGALGAEYKDRLFTAHYMVHKIVTSKLVREGYTFRAEDEDFLASNEHYLRLTDVLEDADGSLLFVDMGGWYTYGFLGNHLPRPTALGAIYRIRRADAPKAADPWGRKLGLDRRPPAELAALLDDPRHAVRDQAVHQLGKRGGEAVPALADLLQLPAKHSARARRNAVWALGRVRTEAALRPVRRALLDPDLGVRLAATHLLGLERDPAAVTTLGALLSRTEPAQHRKAAEALGRIGKAQAVPHLLDSLERTDDHFIAHSVTYALIRINDPRATREALKRHTNPSSLRAALVALDQMRDGRLTREDVAPLLDADDPALQQAVLQIVARRPAWSGDAGRVLRKWLAAPADAAREKVLADALLSADASPTVQQVLAQALADPKTPAATRSLLLGVITRSRVEPLPAAWVDGLKHVLARGDAKARGEALAAIRARKVSRLDPQLAALSRQESLPAALRLAALEALVGRRPKLGPEEFSLLTEQLLRGADPLARLTAARTLAAGDLMPEQLLRLADLKGDTSAIALRSLLPIFAKSKDAKVGTTLVAALDRAPAAQALTAAEVDQALREFPAEVRKRADGLRAKLLARQKGQAAYLAALGAELDGLKGDQQAGHELFMSAKASCYACHRAQGRGGDLGPDLSKIGQLRTRAELLESILFPSFIVAPEFQTHQVVTKEGRQFVGKVVRETADALFLRTADLADVRIPRADVEEIAPSPVSIMPDGLERTLTRQELCDLLEFMLRQK